MKTGDEHKLEFRGMRPSPMITSKQHLFERLTAIWSGKNPGTPDYQHIERYGFRSEEGEENRPHS